MDQPEDPTSSSAAIGRVLAAAPEGAKRAAVVLLRRALVEAQGIRTRTCPHCGLSPSAGVFIRELSRVPLLLRMLFVASFVVFPWGPPIVLALGLLLRKKLRLTTTLCADCARADQRARLWRRAAGFGVVLLPIATWILLGSAPLSLTLKTSIIFASLVAGLTHAWIANWRTRGRAISLARVDQQRIGLLAGGSWRAVLEREQPALLWDDGPSIVEGKAKP